MCERCFDQSMHCLPDRRRRNALVLRLQANLLHGDDLAGCLVAALVHDAVCALADFLDLLEVVHGRSDRILNGKRQVRSHNKHRYRENLICGRGANAKQSVTCFAPASFRNIHTNDQDRTAHTHMHSAHNLIQQAYLCVCV